MEFLSWLNSSVLLLALLKGLIFFFAFRLAFLNNWRKHIGYIFILVIFVQHLLITPYYYWHNGIFSIIGTDISEFFGLAFFYNIIGILSFIIGYWSFNRDTGEWGKEPHTILKYPEKNIIIIFFVLYGIVLINMAAGGINIRNLFLGDEIAGLGARGLTYFLQNFADSLIAVLIIAYVYQLPKRTLFWMVIASVFLFSLLGFRYRILLTLFGISIIFLIREKITAVVVRNLIIGFLLFFYIIMFSTANRSELITKRYSALQYNPMKYDSKIIFSQTRSAIADIAIYKLFNNPFRASEHDYGITMFGYVFIRMIPRSVYPDKDKFYPPPQLKTTIQAYDAYWARFSGEATSNFGAFYIAYGWLGIIVCHFLWGLLLSRYVLSIRFNDPLSLTGYIIVSVISFQWITRGYLPQIIDNFVYMMVPVWLLRRMAKIIKV